VAPSCAKFTPKLTQRRSFTKHQFTPDPVNSTRNSPLALHPLETYSTSVSPSVIGKKKNQGRPHCLDYNIEHQKSPVTGFSRPVNPIDESFGVDGVGRYKYKKSCVSDLPLLIEIRRLRSRYIVEDERARTLLSRPSRPW
jgi:hypothetical protein